MDNKIEFPGFVLLYLPDDEFKRIVENSRLTYNITSTPEQYHLIQQRIKELKCQPKN